MADKKKDDADPTEGAQEAMDTITEQGYMGVEVDPTPNENYTVDGVTSNKPTPETDPRAAAKAREASGRR